MRGESLLYCSEKCKQECSLYYQKKYPKGFEPETLDTEFPAFVKKEIFKRDKYKCQICGRTHDLQAHHEFPGSTHHMLSKDVKNGITLCKECHIKVHMLPGCSFSDIASCSQKIKKDLEEKGINLREIPDWAVDKYLKPKENKNVVKRKNVH
jgi:predicted restriction endonuclease